MKPVRPPSRLGKDTMKALLCEADKTWKIGESQKTAEEYRSSVKPESLVLRQNKETSRSKNIRDRSRELTDTGGFLLFLFDARLRVGAFKFLGPLVEGGEDVSSSDESWGLVHQVINLPAQYPTTLTGG